MPEKRIMISGAAGCGKTSLIKAIREKWPGEHQSLEGNKLTIRDLIVNRGFRPPSMVVGTDSTYIQGHLGYNSQVFLRELIDWQMVLCNLHTINMTEPIPDNTIRVLDRCALDSLVYFIYDLVKMGSGFADTLSTGELEESEDIGDKAREYFQTVRQKHIIDRAQHLVDTTIQYVWTKIQRDRWGSSSSQYWDAVIENVYEVLTSDVQDYDDKRLFGEEVEFPQWDSYSHLKEDACRRIAYILTQYIMLIMDTSGVYVFLTHNPHTGPTEEDGLRVTDSQVNLTLEAIGADVIRSLFRARTEYNSVATFTGALHVPETNSKMQFRIEGSTPEHRSADIQEDIKRRIQEIYLDYQRYLR